MRIFLPRIYTSTAIDRASGTCRAVHTNAQQARYRMLRAALVSFLGALGGLGPQLPIQWLCHVHTYRFLYIEATCQSDNNSKRS